MLPKIPDPIIEIEIPSFGRLVKFRPFKVREEKILLLAKQEGSSAQMLNGVLQIVGNCCLEDDIDVSTLPYFDVEMIFVKLRIAAVGNKIEFKLGDKEARTDFENVKIRGDILRKPGKVKLTNEMAVTMKYPTSLDMVSLGDDESEIMVDLVRICMHKIVNGDDVTDFTAVPIEEQREWINNLTSDQYASFKAFFDTLPTVVVDSKYKDSEGTIHSHELSGLRNFF